MQKNYVSFYLMPVYAFPDLLQRISPDLRKHMQGKPCFKFTANDPVLLRELSRLVRRGYQRFKKEGFLL